MQKNKVLLLDDDKLSLMLYSKILESEFDVVAFSTAQKAIELLRNDRSFAVVISDYFMPELNGIEFLQIARNTVPEAVRILITGYADLGVAVQAVNIGNVYKFLLKPCQQEELIAAVKEGIKIHTPNSQNGDKNTRLVESLTEREIEVLTLLQQGLSNKEIAETMNVSVGTVKTHLNNLFGKLEVNNRIKAVSKAVKMEII